MHDRARGAAEPQDRLTGPRFDRGTGPRDRDFDEDGMPISMQLVGRPHAEAVPLKAADAFGRATGRHLRRPAAARAGRGRLQGGRNEASSIGSRPLSRARGASGSGP
jgi:hypothetical protein